MSFESDMNIAKAVLDQMNQKFVVANPVGKPALNTEADNWQMEVRREIAGKEATLLQVNTVKIDGTFYLKYGAYIENKIRNIHGKTPLKCFDFNAYIANAAYLFRF